MTSRRAHERALLDHYSDRLTGLGGPRLNADEAWLRYRAAMIYGYFLWAITQRVDPAITSLTADAQAEFSKKLVALIEKEGAGYDFAYYRDAPAGLRIWCGATVEASDVALLTQWIDWAFAETRAALPKAA